MATAVGLPSAGASAKVPAGGMTLRAAIGPVGYLGSLPRGFSGCLPAALATWQYQVRMCAVCLVAGEGGALLLRSLLSPDPPCAPQTQLGSGPVGPPGCSQPDVCMRNSLKPELALLAFWPGSHPAPWAICSGTLTLLEQPPAWASECRIVPLHWLLAGLSYSLDRPLAGVCLRIYFMLTAAQNSLAWAPTALCALPQPHPPWPLSPSAGHPNPLASLFPVLYLVHST